MGTVVTRTAAVRISNSRRPGTGWPGLSPALDRDRWRTPPRPRRAPEGAMTRNTPSKRSSACAATATTRVRPRSPGATAHAASELRPLGEPVASFTPSRASKRSSTPRAAYRPCRPPPSRSPRRAGHRRWTPVARGKRRKP
jgi:hypothetical protein